MSRLTISLPDELHRALKEAAVRRGVSIGDLVAESLEFYGIKSRGAAETIVARAREAAGMEEADALELVLVETNASRER